MSWKKLMKAQVLSVLAASIYCSLLAAQEVPAFYKSTCEDIYRALESVKKASYGWKHSRPDSVRSIR